MVRQNHSNIISLRENTLLLLLYRSSYIKKKFNHNWLRPTRNNARDSSPVCEDVTLIKATLFGRHLRVIRNVVVTLLLILFCVNSAIAGKPVTVIYPVYHTDTDRIIAEIREGMHSTQGIDITELAYDPFVDSQHLRDRIARLTDNDIVITLTSELEIFVRTSGFSGQLIDGVSSDFSINNSTVRVGIKPLLQIYLDTLKKLRPGIKKLIYFSSLSKDTIKNEELHQVSGQNQINIALITVDEINNAMHEINDVFAHADPQLTAIWLPDKVLSMSNNIVLKYVLREAWRRSLIVFTDSLDAVARGLLFTLIPDYHAYGKYLGQKAADIASGEAYPLSETIRYFNDVSLMINQRFAIHLGVNLSRSVFDKYRIVVPAK